MTTSTKATPAVRQTPLLWRTWFEAAMRALDDRDCESAVVWFDQALCFMKEEQVSVSQCAITEANLAFAHDCLRDRYCDCLQKTDILPEERKRLQGLAEVERKAACEHAAAALPHLNAASTDETEQLARGRASFACANAHACIGESAEAVEFYASAYKALNKITSQTDLILDVLTAHFETVYKLGDYKAALPPVVTLRSLVGDDPKLTTYRAWIFASEADVLFRLGRYADADDLYNEWYRITSAATFLQTKEDLAKGYLAFGRSRLATGHFDDAETCFEAARRLICCTPNFDKLLEFDVLLAQAQLFERRGEYSCGEVALSGAEAILTAEEKRLGTFVAGRKARFCVGRGRQLMATGMLEQATKCFCTAWEIAERDLDCRYYLAVPALQGLAHIASDRGDLKCSLQHVECALNILDKQRAHTSPEMARTLYELAYSYASDSRLEDAQPASEEALRRLRFALQSPHVDEAEIQLTLARSLASQHHTKRALHEVRSAQDRFLRETPCNLFNRARALRVEASIYHQRRDYCRAMHLLTCALELWQEQERRIDPVHVNTEKCMFLLDLATLQVAQGEDQKAAEEWLVGNGFFPMAHKFKCSDAAICEEILRRARQSMKHCLRVEACWLTGLAKRNYHAGDKDLDARIKNSDCESCPCVCCDDSVCCNPCHHSCS